jgi:hypothetical protein
MRGYPAPTPGTEAVMSFLFPTSPATLDAVSASWTHQPITYLAVAAVCLVVALRFLKRALSPIGALIQAVAAAALVAFAAVLALAMLVIAAFTTVR